MARRPGRRSQPPTRPAVAPPAAKVSKTPPATLRAPERAAWRLDRARARLIAILVACATLPYLNILVNGFVYDDDGQVVRNAYVRSFRYLKEIFTTNVWSFGNRVSNFYRPMMMLGYLFCYKIFGLNAYGFHLVSILLHALVVCLVFALAERLTGDRVCAFVAGALFALHPVHTESVDWIGAVTDIEVTFFYLLTFMFFLALARPGGRRSQPLLAAMGAAFILTLLSKEQAMTLPALATVYEHFYREDRSETSISQKLARYDLLWLLGAAYMILRIQFLGTLAPLDLNARLTPKQLALTAIALSGHYVEMLLWPVRLCAYYVFHPSTSLFAPRVLAGLLALLALAALFLVCWRSRERNVRFASFAILWFFATLAPVLNPHWLGYSVFAERYLYLPSVGVAWLAGLGASKLWSRAAAHQAQRRALVAAGMALAGLFAVRIVVRNRDWKNDIVLYSRTLELAPDAYRFAGSLGLAYLRAGFPDKAESLWRHALTISPNSEIYNDLGLLARRRKQYPEAVDFFQRAIRLSPKDAEPHHNLGTTYRLMGMPGPAELQLRAAMALAPPDDRVLNELGSLLLEEGRENEARDMFLASARRNPNVLAYDFLGEIDMRRGSWDEAERDFRAALGVDESDINAHLGLGDVYRNVGRKNEALVQYEIALLKDPANARAQAAAQELRLETGK